MAANSLVNSVGWGTLDMCTSAQGQALQVQAGQSINRTNTLSGGRSIPLNLLATGTTDFGVTSAGMVTQGALNGYWHRIPLIGLPNGHILNWASAWILPTSTTRSGLQPTGMPTLKLAKQLCTLAGTITLLDTAVATWGSEAAYEAGQELRCTPSSSETIDLNLYDYFLHFQGEWGTNSVIGLELHGISADVTIDTAYGGADLTMWRKS